MKWKEEAERLNKQNDKFRKLLRFYAKGRERLIHLNSMDYAKNVFRELEGFWAMEKEDQSNEKAIEIMLEETESKYEGSNSLDESGN